MSLTKNGKVRKQHPLMPRLPAHELKTGYRTERGKRAHRLLVERRTGIKLPAKAVVHHVDPNDKATNQGHFVVCEDGAYHALIESRTRAYNACGNANYIKCRFCKKWDDPKNMLAKVQRQRRESGAWYSFTRYDHYQYKYRCVDANAPELKQNNYAHAARTEGIWEAISERMVRCTLCGLKMSCQAFTRAAHAKVHVRRGEAVIRKEPALNIKKVKIKERTVYCPAPGIFPQLSERAHAVEGQT